MHDSYSDHVPAESAAPMANVGASFMYWLAAHSYFLPGLSLQRYSFLFGLLLATRRSRGLSRRLLYRLLNGTLDSTAYFEFDFAWKTLSRSELGCRNYL